MSEQVLYVIKPRFILLARALSAKITIQSQFMPRLAKYRVLFTLLAALLIILVTVGVIIRARGFKPNFKNRTLDRTGLIAANSIPTGAHIFLDGRLTSATNTNIDLLDPKTYKIRIEKDGFSTWEKDVEVKADLVTDINALLLPQAPEIKPLTTTGASNPTLSPDGAKIVYGVSGERGGLYLLLMDNSPIPFRQNTKLLAKNTASVDYSKSKFIWSPDSRNLIARFEEANGLAIANLLIDSDKSEQAANDISGSLASTVASWQQQIDDRAQTSATQVPNEVKDATKAAQLPPTSPSPSPLLKKVLVAIVPSPKPLSLNYFPNGLQFSPDEDKILYKVADGKYKVYDLKLKKEFTLPDLPDFINISWFPDSRHLVIAQKNIISIIEADSTNKTTIYSGKFENGFVFANPSATRLIILTTLTQPDGTPTNLYAINLR